MKNRRVVGVREPLPCGKTHGPSPEECTWVRSMAGRRTRVPQGVFRYRSMEETNADWERWHTEMVAEDVSIDR
ncbi:MAG: hypothetical protein ABFS45_04900 [Pseudomonadota bacterium]